MPNKTFSDRGEIAGRSLDEVYTEENNKLKLLVSEVKCAVTIDGWSISYRFLHTYGCHSHIAYLLYTLVELALNSHVFMKRQGLS